MFMCVCSIEQMQSADKPKASSAVEPASVCVTQLTVERTHILMLVPCYGNTESDDLHAHCLLLKLNTHPHKHTLTHLTVLDNVYQTLAADSINYLYLQCTMVLPHSALLTGLGSINRE